MEVQVKKINWKIVATFFYIRSNNCDCLRFDAFHFQLKFSLRYTDFVLEKKLNFSKGCCELKVWSLFSTHIFKNVMNNYAWTLVIWWKRKTFIYCIKCYWIKNLLSMVIQNKKSLVVFHKHKINRLHVYYLINVVYLVCLFFSFFMKNWILRYTCKYFF